MAALFTPESEKTRKSASAATNSTAPTSNKPAQAHRLSDANKSGDSLGNPASSGYEGPIKKKATPAPEEQMAEGEFKVPTQDSTPQGLPKVIRLGLGWDKVLLAQKKLCEKARQLFLKLEGPENYILQRKSKGKSMKYQGAILDVDMEILRTELEAKEKKAKEELSSLDKSA